MATKVKLPPKAREVLALIADGSHTIFISGVSGHIYVTPSELHTGEEWLLVRSATLDSLLALRPMVLQPVASIDHFNRQMEATPAAQALLDILTSADNTTA